MMPASEETGVRLTGGQIDDMTMALVDCAYDKDGTVRQSICHSLFELGKKQPSLVLSTGHSYLLKHSKLPQGHRVVILTSMEKIIKESLSSLDKSLAVDLIKLASDEMTRSKEVVPEWQMAASSVLVAIGGHFCNEVMEELLTKFQPGMLPHFFVVQTMANLASSNVFGMVPFLSVVLGTMLPMLGMAKHDNIKWVFATALSKFSEAILDYVANIEKAPDTSVKKIAFGAHMYSAYDVLFNLWLGSREPKLRLAVVDALGQITHIIGEDKLQEQLPKLVPGILGMYRKHPEPFHITQGLSMLLDAATQEGSVMLEPHLDQLLSALFPQVCIPVDYSSPLTVKNHNEVLRCFAHLVRPFAEKIINFLLQKLESRDEKIKLGALSVFRHLINATDAVLEDRKPVILSGLKMTLSDNNNKVKKLLAQTIVAMAHHGYLELEGGQLMVEFIVKQCSAVAEPSGKRPADPDYVSNEALKSMCGNVLHLITSTVENMDMVLWPHLLEYLSPTEYTNAMPILCKNIAHIAGKKRQENSEDYYLDFEKEVNVPKPQEMMARLVVMAGRPLSGGERGLHVLNLMREISPVIDIRIIELWDAVVPKLIQYLEESLEEERWNQKAWEDLVLKLVSKSLDVIDDEEWVVTLGEAFSSHISLYAFLPEEKNFLYKCMGIVLRKSSKKDLVSKELDNIFKSVNHGSQLEREGCAVAFGFTAASHLDAVLHKCEAVAKNDIGKKQSGLMSFFKDQKADLEVEKIKATLMLCFGWIAMYAPPSIVVSRIESTILRSINPHLSNTKDVAVKQNLMRTVDLIGISMHPDHLQVRHTFTQRRDLLNYMRNFLQAEGSTHLSSDCRLLAFKACTTLIKLDPKLPEVDLHDLIKTAVESTCSLPPEGDNSKGKEESYSEVLEQELLMNATFESLDELFRMVIKKDLTPDCIEAIFKHLYPVTLSTLEHERERALKRTHVILTEYLKHLDVAVGGPAAFSNLGALLGRLAPRCSDPSYEVRKVAIDCIQTTLQIALRYDGRPKDSKDQMVDALPTLKDRVKKMDPNILYSVINDLSKVLVKKLPGEQLQPFVYHIMQGLVDLQANSSSGACVVLNNVLKSRGSEIHTEIGRIIYSLHDKLMFITCPSTKTGTLRCIRTLASHHLNTVMDILLGYPLPYDEMIVECWRVIAQDPQLARSVFNYLLDLLGRSLPYEEKPDPRDRHSTIHIATLLPLSATCALKEMFMVTEIQEPSQEYFQRLFSTLLIRMSSMVGAKPPKVPKEDKRDADGKVTKEKKGLLSSSSMKELKMSPVGSSIEAFHQFLVCSHCNGIIQGLDTEDKWKWLQKEDKYPDAYALIGRLLVESQPQHVSKVVASMNTVLSCPYEPQRIMAAAFFAELINQRCGGDMALVELLMNSLLGRLVDTCHKVRMLCITGLGNVASVGREQVQKFSTTVLSALMAGMDDKEDIEDDITLASMNGLSRILAEIDETHIRAILINIALRIRPGFEKEKPAVRASAFTLFGNLSHFGDGPSKAPFLEQIHTNLVSLLLHLNDPEEEVQKACKQALRQLGPLMGSSSVNDMFQKHLLEQAHLHYGEFMNDLAKIIITDFPDKLNFFVMGSVSFFKSSWPEIRSNAVLLVGFLLGNTTRENYANVSKEHVCGAIVLLLRDLHPLVRVHTSSVIAKLHHY